jgi:hypothetical protein
MWEPQPPATLRASMALIGINLPFLSVHAETPIHLPEVPMNSKCSLKENSIPVREIIVQKLSLSI